jgi:hypothetical protein
MFRRGQAKPAIGKYPFSYYSVLMVNKTAIEPNDDWGLGLFSCINHSRQRFHIPGFKISHGK